MLCDDRRAVFSASFVGSRIKLPSAYNHSELFIR